MTSSLASYVDFLHSKAQTANLTLAGSLGWDATIHVVQMADGHYEPEAMARDAVELHRILRHALPAETYDQLKWLMRMEMVLP